MPDESPEVIEQQMQATRESLTEKVSALENQVVDTLHNATTSVNDIVDRVKTTVPETLSGVKETLADVKASVRESFDISQHAREHPWAMVGSAAVVGFLAGMVIFRKTPAVSTPPNQQFVGADPTPTAAFRAPAKLPGWLDQIVDRLGDKVTEEVRKLGEVAVATASASLQNTVEQVLPKVLGHLTPTDELTNHSAKAAEQNGYHPTTSRL